MNDQGKNRKHYYVVVRGWNPGMYTSWFGPQGAFIQVNRFPGALYKGFSDREEAARYAAHNNVKEEFMGSPGPTGEKHGTRSHEGEDHDILLYTDGGCIRNPGPGGYAVVIIADGSRTEYSGGFRRTTNNRMELMACIVGLESLPRSTRKIRLYSDSRYVVDAVEKKWVFRWKRNNWMRDKNHPAENADLWSRLLESYEIHEVTFHWVKGHAGHRENERCDALARQASMGTDLPADTAYEERKTQSSQGVLFDD
ncbi:MAG: ribonuclease HI [Desulfomonilia bacterium]|nr:ribonuclease HI [Desulfomonilia bacterium]